MIRDENNIHLWLISTLYITEYYFFYMYIYRIIEFIEVCQTQYNIILYHK